MPTPDEMIEMEKLMATHGLTKPLTPLESERRAELEKRAKDQEAERRFDAWMGYPTIPGALRNAFKEAFMRGWHAAIDASGLTNDTTGGESVERHLCENFATKSARKPGEA